MEMEMEMEMDNSYLVLLLPGEIVANIFYQRLPFHSIIQCKFVCKTWRDLLTGEKRFLLRLQPYNGEPAGFHYGEYDDKMPCFILPKKKIFNHHQYHPFENANRWYVIGSCNGLICLRPHQQKWIRICTSSSSELPDDDDDDYMYVCNPRTGEYAKLPKPNHPGLVHPHLDLLNGKEWVLVNQVYGFGYHPITKDYKVVIIYYHQVYYSFESSSTTSPTTWAHVQVYTLGSSGTVSWRSIGEIKHKLYRSCTYGNESQNNSWGILLNGLLYWLTESAELIISFDMADEEFREIPTPSKLCGCSVLGLLDGCLCLSAGMDGNTLIWVMNNDDYSWVKKFSISWRNNFKSYYPLAHLESGNILLHSNFNKLVSYDPKTEHIVELKMMDRSFDIIPYTKTNVSLKALGEKEATK